MKTKDLMRWTAVVVAGLVVPAGLTGCGNAALLPGTLEISLPDNTTATVTVGEGPASLANTQWALYRTSDDLFLTNLTFDENGGLTSMDDNQIFAPDVFGPSIVADGNAHATLIDGLTYTAATYGSENDSGFSFEARAEAFFSGLKVGTGRAYATGTHDGQDMSGTFGFSMQVQGIATSFVPEDTNSEDEFAFYGVRIDQ